MDDLNRNSTAADLRAAEANAISNSKEPSYFTGSGRTPNNNQSRGKLFGKKKSFIVTVIIALALAGGIIFLAGSNSLLAPAMSALMTSKTQTNYTSYTLRTAFITKIMLSGTISDTVTTGFSGQAKYAKIPNYMRKRFSANGIEVTGSGSNTRMSWNGINDIDADQFIELRNDNPAFRDAVTKAKRGRIATFFDKVADKFYSFIGIPRNSFKDFVQNENAEVDAENYKNTLGSKFDGDEVSMAEHTEWREERRNEKDEIYYVDEENNPTTSATMSSEENVNINNKATSMLESIALVGKVANATCTAIQVGSMIASVASAQQSLRNTNLAMLNMENVSKMMSGAGDHSAINSFLNRITTSVKVDVSDYNSMFFNIMDYIKDGGTGKTKDDTVGETSAKSTTEDGAATGASGFQNMLGDAPVSASSTTNYSKERIFNALGGISVFGGKTALTCTGIRAASSLVSLAVVFTPGGVAKIFGGFAFKVAAGYIGTLALSAFFSFLIPTIGELFFSNPAELIGKPLGHAHVDGVADLNMKAAMLSGLTVGGEKQTNGFNRTTNTILAQEAELDRLNHSPFDVTNHNTFFGSIAYSLLPTLTSSNTTGLASFLRSTTKSLSSLIGGVSAEGEGSSYITNYGNCPILEDIGAVGDIYCNPITIADTSTVELSPTDSTFQYVLMGQRWDPELKEYVLCGPDTGYSGCRSVYFHECIDADDFISDPGCTKPNITGCDKDGNNCQVVKGSYLYRYINYCNNRTSPFGVVDQNILGELEGNNALLNSIPVLQDVINVVNATKDAMYMIWATGAICANTNDNSDFWNSKGKYFQRYVEDERILEQMYNDEAEFKNPVTQARMDYEKDYLEAHPEANTYKGILARASGLTLENTETTLAFIQYYDYLNKYDPSTRIAMQDGDLTRIKTGEDIVAEIKQGIIDFSSPEYIENPIETDVIIAKYAIYYDIRNRSYTV